MRFIPVLLISTTLCFTVFPTFTLHAKAPQAQPRPLVSGERVRVKKITRDIASAMQELDKNGVKPFQDPDYVKRWQQSYERHKQALAKYPQVTDPDVMAANQKLQEFANLIQFGISQSNKQVQQTGNVQSRLANIEQALRENQAPGWLQAPFSEARARQWINTAGLAKGTAEKALTALTEIAQTAYLPVNSGTVQSGVNYDKQDVGRLTNMANTTLRKVNEAISTTEQNLRQVAETQGKELLVYNEIDPNDPSDQSNYFLNEGAEAMMFAGFERQIAIANTFVAYQKAMGNTPNKAITDRVAYIDQVRQRYSALRDKIVGERGLPPAKSTDAELMRIAEAILANPKYQFGQHGPVVITTENIAQREKELSEEEYNDIDISLAGEITLTGTKTTWHYRWDEFKFATPILDNQTGKWYLWWITAKKFYSGASTTPIGEWVSGSATKGEEILKTNF